MRTSTLLFVMLVFASFSLAQRNGPTGQRQAAVPRINSKRVFRLQLTSSRQWISQKLKSDADELIVLSQSIHSGVNDVQKGMLPKDLIAKLKQVEKLSKRLRSELTP